MWVGGFFVLSGYVAARLTPTACPLLLTLADAAPTHARRTPPPSWTSSQPRRALRPPARLSSAASRASTRSTSSARRVHPLHCCSASAFGLTARVRAAALVNAAPVRRHVCVRRQHVQRPRRHRGARDHDADAHAGKLIACAAVPEREPTEHANALRPRPANRDRPGSPLTRRSGTRPPGSSLRSPSRPQRSRCCCRPWQRFVSAALSGHAPLPTSLLN